MSISCVVSSPDGHTQVRTYTGITTDEVQAAFEADRAEAARVICDVMTPDGKPFVGDPRGVLLEKMERFGGAGSLSE